MFSTDLNKLHYTRIIAIIAFTFASIVAPFCYIYRFKPAIFVSTDIIRLLLLSLSFGFPISVFNSLFVPEFKTKSKEDNFIVSIGTAPTATLLVFYIPIFFSFYMHISFFSAKTISTIIEIILVVCFKILSNADGKMRLAKKLNMPAPLADPLLVPVTADPITAGEPIDQNQQ